MDSCRDRGTNHLCCLYDRKETQNALLDSPMGLRDCRPLYKVPLDSPDRTQDSIKCPLGWPFGFQKLDNLPWKVPSKQTILLWCPSCGKYYEIPPRSPSSGQNLGKCPLRKQKLIKCPPRCPFSVPNLIKCLFDVHPVDKIHMMASRMPYSWTKVPKNHLRGPYQHLSTVPISGKASMKCPPRSPAVGQSFVKGSIRWPKVDKTWYSTPKAPC